MGSENGTPSSRISTPRWRIQRVQQRHGQFQRRIAGGDIEGDQRSLVLGLAASAVKK